MTTTKKELKKEMILKAASHVVREEGVDKLTLEAVAKQAGISKGGLLYHFPNKEELILGMVERMSNHFVGELHERAEHDPDPKGKWTRAYVETSFSEDQDVDGLYTALSAAHFTHPKMLKLLQEEYKDIQHQLEHDELDPVRATMVRLVVDGLWFAGMFNLAPPDAKLQQQIIEKLQNDIKEQS